MQRMRRLRFVEGVRRLFGYGQGRAFSPLRRLHTFSLVHLCTFLAMTEFTFLALCNFMFVVAVFCCALVCVFRKQITVCASFCSAVWKSARERFFVCKALKQASDTTNLCDRLCSRCDVLAVSWADTLITAMTQRKSRGSCRANSEQIVIEANRETQCNDEWQRKGTSASLGVQEHVMLVSILFF